MAACGVLMAGAGGDCDDDTKAAPRGRCDSSFAKYYDECKLTLTRSGEAPLSRDEAVQECQSGFPPSTTCFALCAECKACPDVATCTAEHCGAADVGRCSGNLDYLYQTCGHRLSAGWFGEPVAQADATTSCQEDVGLAVCVNDCINTPAGRRSCDDADNCIQTICWLSGQNGPGTAVVPQPCPSSTCQKTCAALAGMDSTCPRATRSYEGCLQGCQALNTAKPLCVSCLELWFKGSDLSCASLEAYAQGTCAHAGTNNCYLSDFAWAK